VPRSSEQARTVLLVEPSGRAALAGSVLFSGDREDLLQAIGELVDSRGVHAIMTPNVDQVIVLPTERPMADAYRDAALRIADGSPLVLLGRLLGAHDLHRLTGADLLVDVARVAPQHGWRVAVAGGGAGVAQTAAVRLRERFGTDAVAVDFPRMSSVDDPRSAEVIADLTAAAPDVVFICLGAPKQDVWIHRWRDALPPAVYVGAGAAVDFVAGTKRRAPLPVQRLGFEWAFRLAQEPRRLAYRYLVRGPRFIPIVLRSLRAARQEQS
jgi:N-acetylglucosaminyldiphosphoundecaprenol N-acetyl-beta-D-mannosaminyltransferase